ncbi:hypothetical protein [Nocardiopsis sp. FIRDI 009]|uniref:hypothetical protein n=1 Tax=Nocardiopsis sp. FIRDI 009 TaxID=714197 RepID=UPI001E512B81|nr:hypothetical protein [Nocardiopsis sp. FIRDI 009]
MVAAAVLALVLFAFYLSWRATRLDRLHHRVETARAALDAALLRRGSAVLDLVAADGLPPEHARALADAATAARRAPEAERELAESALSRALRAAVDPLDAPRELHDHLAEVVSEARRVHLARTFHNDAVADTRRARRSRLVRALRLAGTAPLPDFFEIDDEPPAAPPPPAGSDTL